MTNFILGILVGLVFSLIAVLVGKKLSNTINDPYHTGKHLKNSLVQPKAEIIKNEDPIEKFLNEYEGNK